MNAERDTTVLFDDRARFERVGAYLPEDSIRYLMHCLLASVMFSREQSDMLFAYEEDVQKSQAFVFSNPIIQDRYERMNAALSGMHGFMTINFGVNPNQTDFFSMYPDLKNSGDAEKTARWHKYHDELIVVGEAFEAAYADFMKVSVQELGKKEIATENAELPEGVIQKGKKRITLPVFPRTNWSQASLNFIGDREVLISNGKDMKQSNFEGLGFADGRTGRPTQPWEFLLALAHGEGATPTRPKGERESYKKRKQDVVAMLQNLFNNDTDPIDSEKGGAYRAKFAIKYTHPEGTIEAGDTRYADSQTVFDEMTPEVYEQGS